MDVAALNCECAANALCAGNFGPSWLECSRSEQIQCLRAIHSTGERKSGSSNHLEEQLRLAVLELARAL